MARTTARQESRREALRRAHPPLAERQRIRDEYAQRQARQGPAGRVQQYIVGREIRRENQIIARQGWSADGLDWARRAAAKEPARSQAPTPRLQPWHERRLREQGAELPALVGGRQPYQRAFAAVVGALQGEPVDGLIVAGPDTE
jgi:hypothetical protein